MWNDEGNLISCSGFLARRGGARGSMIHHENRALSDYWHLLRAGRPCPFRAEIDPRSIRSRIGHVFILESLGRGNIRFRLAGSALVSAFGMELRGMPLRSIMLPEGRQSIVEVATETLDDCGLASVLLRRAGQRGELWELSLMPLRSDQGRVDRLLGALHPLDPVDRMRSDPPLAFALETVNMTTFLAPARGEAERTAAAAPVQVAAAMTGERPRLQAIDGGLSGLTSPRRMPAPRTRARIALHVIDDE